ncbi:MAG: DNA mismatch repair endonuclease MutL [Deltaproteobacteria bacterium]|nr:DNA mismatch repair endonuclease MutL [Deltaproteobacteria bacterium]
MARIQVLPDAVINKIAAGEVVERPASVVKELLENALDAGGTRILVSVVNGGKDHISVLDNGQGMDEADARLAVRRHATSKIRDETELEGVTTLGFRGEALAAIAAVSRFELTTCVNEQAGGFRLTLVGGRETAAGRVGFPQGTRVTVEALFQNIPARRKFLRATSTEFQQIQQVLTHAALANPAVAFRLMHDQRLVQELPPAETLAERVRQIFGGELHQGLIPVQGREGLFAYEGLVSHPSHAKASKRWQYLFINGRPVRNAGIQHAVGQGYRTLLMKDRHPAFILKLHLEPTEVDVNVHPAKTEVRLRNPQLIHAVLSTGLHKHVLAATREGWEHPGDRGPVAQTPQGALPLAARETRDWGAVEEGAPAAGGSAIPESSLRAWGAQPALVPAPEDAGEGTLPGGGLRPEGLRDNPFSSPDFHFQPLVGGRHTDAALGEAPALVLAQFHNTYLLAQRGDTLLLVDQHAAHERILFEQYRTQFYEGRLATAPYLLPPMLELSPQNALLLEQYLPQWNKMGFGIEAFGRNTYLLRHVPSLVAGKDVQGLVLEVLDELALFGKSGRLEEVFNEILERTACHSAIRAGQVLAREEMAALLAQLAGMDINLYCPHGRPVWVEFPLRDLEKRFKRIV